MNPTKPTRSAVDAFYACDMPPRLPVASRLLLLHLAVTHDRAQSPGGMMDISLATRLETASLNKALKSLEDAQLLEIERGTGGRRANSYRLLILG